MNHLLENLFPHRYPGVTVRSEDTKPATNMPDPIDNQESFGYNFNLIRAVQEYGPQRIDAIGKRLDTMMREADALEQERRLLEQLVAIVTPVP